MKTLSFTYHRGVLDAFPNTVGGVILASDLTNPATPESLLGDYSAQQEATLAHIGSTPLSELASLAAWRSVFRQFGVNPTKYRSAPEALLRRLTKKGDIPSINTLVDIANMISIRYILPVAVFDTQHLQGGMTVHFADGSERFTPLGASEVEHPEKDEVVFSDANKLVVARRWCWRQSAESAAGESLTSAIITVEAQHDSGRQEVEAALSDLQGLLKSYAGGTLHAGVLDYQTPTLEVYD